jgi:hypothetical protein
MKVMCTERGCDWVGEDTEMLVAGNPFNPHDELTACPKCKTVENTVFVACDEPGCKQQSSCGTPTSAGYRNTCHNHMPIMERTNEKV